MGRKLADFLVHMVDPHQARMFYADPLAFMKRAGLSKSHIEAIMSGKSGWIRVLGLDELQF